MLASVAALVFAYALPLHFTAEQEYNARVILDQAVKLGEDPYHLMATAWVESRLIGSRVSATGDYGIFQINYKFWGRLWGFTDTENFWLSMLNPNHATIAAVTVIREMRRYKSCKGDMLAACYNGGPAWQRSKNKDKILSYAKKVNNRKELYKRNYPQWKRR